MTLLDGLGDLDAMNLDANFACLLLLFLDNEELVRRWEWCCVGLNRSFLLRDILKVFVIGNAMSCCQYRFLKALARLWVPLFKTANTMRYILGRFFGCLRIKKVWHPFLSLNDILTWRSVTNFGFRKSYWWRLKGRFIVPISIPKFFGWWALRHWEAGNRCPIPVMNLSIYMTMTLS